MTVPGAGMTNSHLTKETRMLNDEWGCVMGHSPPPGWSPHVAE
jgi:hypothetical protein